MAQTDETQELWQEFAKSRDKAVRDRLILTYAPLVKYVAGRLGSGLPAHVDEGDLVSYGLLGLIGAIERYDPDRDVKFETYAISRIKGAIIDELRALDWVPRSVRARARHIERAIAELEGKLHRAPTDEEIAEKTKLSLKHVREVRAAARAVASLDKPVGQEGTTSFGELIAGESTEPSEEVHVSLAERAVRSAVETLPEREREVVKRRYGMNGDRDPESLEQIGRHLGLTRERVRQIEAQALQRLAERREVAALGEHAA